MPLQHFARCPLGKILRYQQDVNAYNRDSWRYEEAWRLKSKRFRGIPEIRNIGTRSCFLYLFTTYRSKLHAKPGALVLFLILLSSI